MLIESLDMDKRITVVAEIGNNHEGDASLAMEMVAAAAEAGADAVKVQVFTPERWVNIAQKERIAQLTGFKLPLETFEEMAKLAKSKGMLFIATPFDTDSLDAVTEFVSAVKIASSDLDFVPLLAAAAGKGKPIILSTGMGTLTEIGSAVDTISEHLPRGKSVAESLVLLHCITSYPTPFEEANLRAMQTLRDTFHLTTGYSDHTLGIEVAVLAAGLGARVIEKHFTLDKSRTTFRDHAVSADPQDMLRLTSAVHALDDILGSGEKTPMPCESENAAAVRRSIVASRDLPAHTRLSFGDFDYVRPRNGLLPSDAQKLVERELRVPLSRHDVLLESHLTEAGE